MGVRNALTLVGAVIGGIYGGPAGAQLGATIGGAVGSIVDPQVFKAPSVGDVALQKVGEGMPIPQYDGKAGGAGILVYCSEPDIVEVEEEQGKATSVVESERIYISFVILIGQALRDGPGQRTGIQYLLRVWQDEKLMYDVNPGSEILDASAEWAEQVGLTFYPGTLTQNPDPDLEAIEGAGNVPAYPGRSYVAFKNFDSTALQGSPPRFRFEVATEPDEDAPEAVLSLITNRDNYSGPPTSLVREDPNFLATSLVFVRGTADGLGAAGISNESTTGTRVQVRTYDPDSGNWTNLSLPYTPGTYGPAFLAWSPQSDEGAYYLALGTRNAGQKLIILKLLNGVLTLVSLEPASVPTGNPCEMVAAWDATGDRLCVAYGSTVYVYDFVSEALVNPRSVASPVDPDGDPSPVNISPISSCEWQAMANARYCLLGGQFGLLVVRDDSSSMAVAAFASEGLLGVTGPAMWDSSGGYIVSWNKYRSVGEPPSVLQWTGGVPGLEDIEFVWDSPDTPPSLVIDASIYRDGKHVACALGTTQIVLYDFGDSLPPYPERIADAPTAISGNVYSLHFNELPQGALAGGDTNLARIIKACGRRCRMPDSVWNLPGLDHVPVRGIVVASQAYTARDLINGLMWTYPGGGACFNGQIHITLRGGAVDLELDEQFLVDEDSDQEEDEVLRNGDDRQTAPLRLPAKVNLMFPNAKLGYQLTKATSPNFGQGGESVSEVTIEVPVVLNEETEAPALADVLDKVARTEAQGELVRLFPDYLADQVVPETIIRLVNGALSRRARATTVRIGEGTRRLGLVLDRARDFSSQATAPPSAGWPTPPPSQVGLTDLIVMNLPVLRDADDLLGVYAGISGEPGSAWYGARIQYRVQGTTTWNDLGTFTTRTVMGELVDAFPYAPAAYPDYANPLVIELKVADELETLSVVEWLSEMGAWAVVRDDGTAEIVQPRVAVNDSGQTWTLTEHQRGRLATSTAAHLAGARAVKLSRAVFLPLPTSAIGQTLEFRAISSGGSAEDAVVHELVFDPLSQTEFAVAGLSLTRAGGTIDGSWIELRRLGTEVIPIRSINWEGFLVTLTDGSVTQTFETTETSFSRSDAAFSGPITVTVQQLNRFTGPGPSTSEIA